MNYKTLLNFEAIFSKFSYFLFQRNYPEAPWLTSSAVFLLNSWLRKDDIGLEWGSGRSTIWLASRVKHLTSVESNHKWFTTVKNILLDKGLNKKVNYNFIPVDIKKNYTPMQHPYTDIIFQLPDNYFDFTLIDGKLRLLCIETAISKIKPGGILILDNAERFVPNKLMGKHIPYHTKRDCAPNKRWETVLQQLTNWRHICTCDNIRNTLFWIKPIPGTIYD